MFSVAIFFLLNDEQMWQVFVGQPDIFHIYNIYIYIILYIVPIYDNTTMSDHNCWQFPYLFSHHSSTTLRGLGFHTGLEEAKFSLQVFFCWLEICKTCYI